MRDLLQLNLRYGLGLTGLPSVDDPDFVSALVFDASRGATTPKARFAYLFPSEESALIQVRLEPGLSDEARNEAVGLVREAVRMPQWKLAGEAGYTVTGAPVVAEDLTDALAGSTLRLLIAGLVLMAIVLGLVFRSRLRLVPLAVALAAVAITFGAGALLGLPLTMASIAVLPVLLGLGVDYAIQYQARVNEEGSAGRAARVAVPVIATAALATGVGFLVLLLSPVPMVRGFGALLVVGIAIAFVVALTAGTAALTLGARPRDGALARSLRGAGELVEAAAESGGAAAAGAGSPGRLGHGGRRAAAARAGARGRAGGRRRRLGGRLAHGGGLRRRATGAAGPAGGTGPRGAPARDRGRGRDRRRRRRPRPDRSRGREVDARLPGRRARSATGTRPSAAAARRSCARRCRCPTCSARPSRRATASASAGCSTRCRRTSRRP